VRGGSIEVTQQAATLRNRQPSLRIDLDTSHRRKINHQGAIGHCCSSNIVSASADRHRQMFAACAAYCRTYVRSRAATNDERWHPIMHSIPDSPRRIELRISRKENFDIGY
jgi:hypothetical protein